MDDDSGELNCQSSLQESSSSGHNDQHNEEVEFLWSSYRKPTPVPESDRESDSSDGDSDSSEKWERNFIGKLVKVKKHSSRQQKASESEKTAPTSEHLEGCPVKQELIVSCESNPDCKCYNCQQQEYEELRPDLNQDVTGAPVEEEVPLQCDERQDKKKSSCQLLESEELRTLFNQDVTRSPTKHEVSLCQESHPHDESSNSQQHNVLLPQESRHPGESNNCQENSSEEATPKTETATRSSEKYEASAPHESSPHGEPSTSQQPNLSLAQASSHPGESSNCQENSSEEATLRTEDVTRSPVKHEVSLSQESHPHDESRNSQQHNVLLPQESRHPSESNNCQENSSEEATPNTETATRSSKKYEVSAPHESSPHGEPSTSQQPNVSLAQASSHSGESSNCQENASEETTPRTENSTRSSEMHEASIPYESSPHGEPCNSRQPNVSCPRALSHPGEPSNSQENSSGEATPRTEDVRRSPERHEVSPTHESIPHGEPSNSQQHNVLLPQASSHLGESSNYRVNLSEEATLRIEPQPGCSKYCNVSSSCDPNPLQESVQLRPDSELHLGYVSRWVKEPPGSPRHCEVSSSSCDSDSDDGHSRYQERDWDRQNEASHQQPRLNSDLSVAGPSRESEKMVESPRNCQVSSSCESDSSASGYSKLCLRVSEDSVEEDADRPSEIERRKKSRETSVDRKDGDQAHINLKRRKSRSVESVRSDVSTQTPPLSPRNKRKRSLPRSRKLATSSYSQLNANKSYDRRQQWARDVSNRGRPARLRSQSPTDIVDRWRRSQSPVEHYGKLRSRSVLPFRDVKHDSWRKRRSKSCDTLSKHKQSHESKETSKGHVPFKEMESVRRNKSRKRSVDRKDEDQAHINLKRRKTKSVESVRSADAPTQTQPLSPCNKKKRRLPHSRQLATSSYSQLNANKPNDRHQKWAMDSSNRGRPARLRSQSPTDRVNRWRRSQSPVEHCRKLRSRSVLPIRETQHELRMKRRSKSCDSLNTHKQSHESQELSKEYLPFKEMESLREVPLKKGIKRQSRSSRRRWPKSPSSPGRHKTAHINIDKSMLAVTTTKSQPVSICNAARCESPVECCRKLRSRSAVRSMPNEMWRKRRSKSCDTYDKHKRSDEIKEPPIEHLPLKEMESVSEVPLKKGVKRQSRSSRRRWFKSPSSPGRHETAHSNIDKSMLEVANTPERNSRTNEMKDSPEKHITTIRSGSVIDTPRIFTQSNKYCEISQEHPSLGRKLKVLITRCSSTVDLSKVHLSNDKKMSDDCFVDSAAERHTKSSKNEEFAGDTLHSIEFKGFPEEQVPINRKLALPKIISESCDDTESTQMLQEVHSANKTRHSGSVLTHVSLSSPNKVKMASELLSSSDSKCLPHNLSRKRKLSNDAQHSQAQPLFSSLSRSCGKQTESCIASRPKEKYNSKRSVLGKFKQSVEAVQSNPQSRQGEVSKNESHLNQMLTYNSHCQLGCSPEADKSLRPKTSDNFSAPKRQKQSAYYSPLTNKESYTNILERNSSLFKDASAVYDTTASSATVVKRSSLDRIYCKKGTSLQGPIMSVIKPCSVVIKDVVLSPEYYKYVNKFEKFVFPPFPQVASITKVCDFCLPLDYMDTAGKKGK